MLYAKLATKYLSYMPTYHEIDINEFNNTYKILPPAYKEQLINFKVSLRFWSNIHLKRNEKFDIIAGISSKEKTQLVHFYSSLWNYETNHNADFSNYYKLKDMSWNDEEFSDMRLCKTNEIHFVKAFMYFIDAQYDKACKGFNAFKANETHDNKNFLADFYGASAKLKNYCMTRNNLKTFAPNNSELHFLINNFTLMMNNRKATWFDKKAICTLSLIKVYSFKEWPANKCESILELITFKNMEKDKLLTKEFEDDDFIKELHFSSLLNLDKFDDFIIEIKNYAKSKYKILYNKYMFFYNLKIKKYDALKDCFNAMGKSDNYYFKGRMKYYEYEENVYNNGLSCLCEAFNCFYEQWKKEKSFSHNCYYLAMCYNILKNTDSNKLNSSSSDISSRLTNFAEEELFNIFDNALLSHLPDKKIEKIFQERRDVFNKKKNIPKLIEGEAESYHIFFSYSWTYKTQCEQIFRLLREHGFNIWFDNVLDGKNPNMGVGDDAKKKMKDSIAKSKIFLCFLSPEYIQSYNCLFELNEAHLMSLPILPVMISKINWDTDFLQNKESQKHLKEINKEAVLSNLKKSFIFFIFFVAILQDNFLRFKIKEGWLELGR